MYHTILPLSAERAITAYNYPCGVLGWTTAGLVLGVRAFTDVPYIDNDKPLGLFTTAWIYHCVTNVHFPDVDWSKFTGLEISNLPHGIEVEGTKLTMSKKYMDYANFVINVVNTNGLESAENHEYAVLILHRVTVFPELKRKLFSGVLNGIRDDDGVITLNRSDYNLTGNWNALADIFVNKVCDELNMQIALI